MFVHVIVDLFVLNIFVCTAHRKSLCNLVLKRLLSAAERRKESVTLFEGNPANTSSDILFNELSNA